MPAKKTTNGAKSVTPQFKGYVRMDLKTADDLEKFHDYEGKSSKETLWDAIADLVADGYKVTFKLDGKGYKVEAFNTSAEEASQGYILGAYGSSLQKATTALAFKHVVLMGSSWVDHLEQEEIEVR